MPDPMSFDIEDTRYATLINEIQAWNRWAACMLWYRTHAFSYQVFVPPTANVITQADKYIADQAKKAIVGLRIAGATVSLNEIRRLTAEGLLDARVLMDSAIIILPDSAARYPWHPDLRPGAPSLNDQLTQIDRRDPWRLYFVENQGMHPTMLFGFRHRLDGAFPAQDPPVTAAAVATPPGCLPPIPTLRTLLPSATGSTLPDLSFLPLGSPSDEED